MVDEVLLYSYVDIHRTIANVVEGVTKFKPDVIIAIGGGGLIPARMLRTYLEIPILVVTLNLYDDKTNTIREKVKKIQWLDSDSIRGKRVVVVDDVDDSRKTTQFCVEELQSVNNPEAIAVAVIHSKMRKKAGKLPEGVAFFAGENVPNVWIKYPWDAGKRNYYIHGSEDSEENAMFSFRGGWQYVLGIVTGVTVCAFGAVMRRTITSQQ